MTISFEWTLIFVGIAFVIGLIFGIKLGVRWMKSKLKQDA